MVSENHEEMMSNSSRNLGEAPAPVTAPEPPYWAKIVSGSVGSIITALAVTPLEVVKVRQQQQSSFSAGFEAGANKPIFHRNHVNPSRAAAFPTSPLSCCYIPTSHNTVRACSQLQKSFCSGGSVRNGVVRNTTFVLDNGLAECVLPKSAVPYFDGRGRVIPPPSTPQPGTIAMLRRIFQVEGLRGLYAGLRPTLVMGVPNTVFYFVTYDDLMTRYRRSTQNTNSSFDRYVPAVAGGMARLLASLVTAPLELVRTRQAASSVHSNNMWQELRHVTKTSGIPGLYRGLSPTLWRDVPFSAVYWFALESLRGQQQQEEFETPIEQAAHTLISASLAGMFAAACTTPMDVLKTRRQVEVSGSTSTTTASRLAHIVRTEGIAALWRGNATRMIKVAPACAIMLSSYELGKRVLS